MTIRKRSDEMDTSDSLPPPPSSSSQLPNSKSFINLTHSALAGVFGSQVSLAELNGDVQSTTTTAASTRQPSRTNSKQNLSSTEQIDDEELLKMPTLSIFTLSVRIVALFVFGVVYGQFSRHLHDNHQITTYTLDIDQTGAFSLLWGSQGIVLGFLLPFFDWMFPERNRRLNAGKGGADWISIIRAAAAFMGIAYGVRKLSWTSTLQAAFYWGMVNPCLWFILDGTRNGFILSCMTAVIGTTVFAIIFPSHLPLSRLNEEYIAVVTWVASVFFCCSICFGNIGRKLLTFNHHRY